MVKFDTATILLLVQGIAILSVGAFIHYDAKSAVKLFHNSPEAVSRETLTVLRGWGSSLMAMGVTAIMLSRLNTHSAKKIMCRGMAIGFFLTALGQYHMFQKAPEWGMATGILLFVAEVGLGLANTYVGTVWDGDATGGRKQD